MQRSYKFPGKWRRHPKAFQLKRFTNHMEFRVFLWLIFNGCGKDRKGSSLLPNLITAQFLRGLSREFVTPAIGSSVVEASAS